MRRTIVVDDEQPARERLKRLLSLHDDVEVVGEASHGQEALALVATTQPDLVFLDIQMPVLDGLSVAHTLGDDGPNIIFATAYDEHALEAFDTAAIDYLVKPISKDRLARALARKAPSPKLPPIPAAAHIAFKCGPTYEVLSPTEVIAIVAEDHYAVVKGARELLCDEPLERLATRLPPNFVHIHRSAIINTNHVTTLSREGDRRYFVIMKGQLRIPVSRTKIATIKEALRIEPVRALRK